VHLAFDICQGIGVAAAVGIRPFLPAVAVGGLAAGDVEMHFDGTSYAFLQSVPFILAMLVAALVLGVLEVRLSPDRLERGIGAVVLGAISLALGALLFAGSLAHGHYAAWPGLIGGVLCAGIGFLVTVTFLPRVRGRLDASAAATLPLYAEGSALLLAVLSVVAPPIGPIGLAGLLWLLLAGRGREQQKYAGLRILR
jgi:hypothetical protein